MSQCRVSASKFVALNTNEKLKALSKYQFFIQNRTNCRKLLKKHGSNSFSCFLII
jgi:hypothetical protein